MSDSNKQAQNRRAFFREVLRRYVEPAADYVEERVEALVPKVRVLLRPPGALPEAEFLEACSRCGYCVEACPANAIQPWGGEDETRRGTPYIDPQKQPCVVCDELACMPACPTGALQKLTVLEIKMGLAVADLETCVRSRGEDCSACVDLCPLGERAIRLDETGRVEVIAAVCTGCGVCQHACPTSPRAIVVKQL